MAVSGRVQLATVGDRGPALRRRVEIRHEGLIRIAAIWYLFWLQFRYPAGVSEHEVYPAASVVLVAMEVRHPASDPLSRHQRNRLKSELGRRTPILKSAQTWGFQVGFGAASVGVPNPQSVNEEYPKYIDRASTIAVSLQSEAMVIETSQYLGWNDFMALARTVFDARQFVAPIDGVTRVGLRFINEIRVPEEPAEWNQWMSPAIQEPSIGKSIEMPLMQWQGFALFGEQPGRAMAVRYGPRTGSTTLQPDPELKPRFKGPFGEFFLLDLDSFAVPNDGVPPYDGEELLQTCAELHSPIREMFESLITPRLRDEVLRNGDR